MKVRSLSATGDYTFGNSLLNFYINVPAAPGQVVGTSLRLFLGEWYLNTALGTPYFLGILGKYSQAIADRNIQNTILSAQGVLNIASYASSINSTTRLYSATAVINTVYGQTVLSISQNPNNGIIVIPVLIPELITQDGFFITTQNGENLKT
jgi:hypothetical protein